MAEENVIEINYGKDAEGNEQVLKLPKKLKDDDGNEYDPQDFINKINGKVKSVTEAKYEKQYGSRIKELETIQERTKGMISADDAHKLQQEIEELRIKQLPEKEQEIARLNLKLKGYDDQINNYKTTADTSVKKYQSYRINQELLMSLPTGENGVIDDIRNDQVEIIRKYAKINDESDKVEMQNIFEQGGEPLDIKTFMEKYYTDPSRAAYLKSSFKSGSGSQQGRNLSGKESYTSKVWQTKLASSNRIERQELAAKLARGEIIVTDN